MIRVALSSIFLVPKLCLGTHFLEALLRVSWFRRPPRGSRAKQSFAEGRSQAGACERGKQSVFRTRLDSLEEGDAGREPVHEISAADWPQFALGEEAGQGNRAVDGANCRRIMVGGRKESRTSAVATEQQSRFGGCGICRAVGVEQAF